jgi:4-amino-4-deoxy-L-arabinose transferase-like glycosyltransferase
MLAVVAFVGGTIFLGEVFDFYNRFWWWDIAMHGGSAIGFGLTGFVLVFMMFQGDRFAAPPSAIAFFAFCFALAIGAMWEVFEFAMDQSFGTNMQKSGLDDTMGDLIVDMGGALIGAGSGYAYLRGRALGGLTGTIEYFVSRNPRLFRKWRK